MVFEIQSWENLPTDSTKISITINGNKLVLEFANELFKDSYNEPIDWIFNKFMDNIGAKLSEELTSHLKQSKPKSKMAGYPSSFSFKTVAPKKQPINWTADEDYSSIYFKELYNQANAGGYSGATDPADLHAALPDLNKMTHCPAALKDVPNCGSKTIWTMVQHLNDKHKWTRHKIADWLEELDIDIALGDK